MFGPFPGAFYLGPEGGWTQLTSQDVKFRMNGRHFSPKADYDAGFNVGVRGGYEWGPWRFEEEYSYRNSAVSSFAGLGNSVFGGNRNTNSIMTNVIYDFTFGWPITPHIGAGIGAVNINDGISANRPINRPIRGLPADLPGSVNGNTWSFGYQGIAGLRYNINPALAFDLDYRYLATPEFTIKTGRRQGLISYNSGYNTHNVVASLTMRFGAPPAAPPPAPPAPPPPAAHQVFLVFFDWDKYNITSDGMAILQKAAQQYKSGAPVQIQVTGYTDLTGSAGYNQRLSERRANAVANALAGMGVARNDMVVTGRGMNDPRVPTPLGVREPQNRRVEIMFP
jgi:outer membrane protein OmpA-like peptidoglycan-associated protein